MSEVKGLKESFVEERSEQWCRDCNNDVGLCDGCNNYFVNGETIFCEEREMMNNHFCVDCIKNAGKVVDGFDVYEMERKDSKEVEQL